jgi:Fic family protein
MKLDRERDLEQILNVLKEIEDGAKIADIAEQMPGTISKRTLLRRLDELKDLGKIVSSGSKSATRYFLKENKFEIPLSKEAEKQKANVNQVIQLRDPVSYNLDFLYDYEANKTFYLTAVERDHLKELGQQFNHALEPGTHIKSVLHRLLLDLSWNSSRLEGNTYSLLETERLIDFGVEAEGKAAFEAQMLLNHKEAIEFIVENIDISNYTVLNTHALLSNNLLSNPKACGKIRGISVGIARTTYKPLDVPPVIEDCFQHILDTASKIEDPFEQAFFLMVHLPYLQSFEDVNKRVSRLVANIPLIKHNLSPLSFIDVPKDDYIDGLLAVYELNKTELLRDVFLWAYGRSAKQYKQVRESIGEPDTFKMKYRNEIRELVKSMISCNYHGKRIIMEVQTWSEQNIPVQDQARFRYTVENEISSLHLGNIAIHKIEPEVYERWNKDN